MPEIKHTFIGGKMNKDLDERIVPNGEYRDAKNIQVRTTDGDAAGTVQGIKGNSNIGVFSEYVGLPGTNLFTQTVGSVVDEKNDNIYFFMAAPSVGTISLSSITSLTEDKTRVFTDGIVEQNVDGTTTPVIIDEHTLITSVQNAFTASSSITGYNTEGDLWQEIKITDIVLKEKIRPGMKMEIFNAEGVNQTPGAFVKSVYVNTTNDTVITLHTGYDSDVSTLITDNTGWVKFSSPRVLNFNYDSQITAINIIDNLLIWTDGDSEPKKINIDRCKAGTPAFVADEHVINGDFSEDITLNTNNDPLVGWATTNAVNLGGETVPSVGVYTNSDGVNVLTLVGLQHWNPVYDDNNGEVRQNVTGLIPGDTYEFSFDYVITAGTLTSDLNNAIDINTSLTGSGTHTESFVATTDTLDIIFYGTNATLPADGAVYGNVFNVSLLNTGTTTYSHTKLFVSDPTDIDSDEYIPITELEVYDFEGDKIDDSIKEEHITVIKKAPLVAPSIILNETDRGQGAATVNITGCPFISSTPQSSTSGLNVNDIRIFTSDNLDSTIFRVNDILYFDSSYLEYNDDQSTVLLEVDLRITCRFMSYLDDDQNEVYEATNTIKVEISSFPTEYLDHTVTDWSVSLKQKEPLYELKLGRFAYRYVYEDGEYSTFSPWSELAFLPGFFEYESRGGHNAGMKNNVREIIIKDFVPFKTKPLDVKSIDILYKATNSASCYVVKTISRGVDAEWELFSPNTNDVTGNLSGQLHITSEAIHTIISDDQILRTWDNVPRYASSQEITGNRLLFGNYVQGYDVQLPVGLTQEIISEEITSIKYPNKSIKSMRDYKWGMVFGDKYGRETPVFTSGYTSGYLDTYSSLTGDISLNKEFCNTKNYFRLKQTWDNPINLNNAPPDWADYVKFYVKETSNEYYNLVLNGWYYADDIEDTVWLSFQSTDRNKVDEETYLILKSVNGEAKPVKENSKYKIISISNSAPDYIKTKHLDIGNVQITPGDGATGTTIWSSGNGVDVTNTIPDNLITPGNKGRMFSIDTNVWGGIFGMGANNIDDRPRSMSASKLSFRVRGTAGNVRKYTRWIEITNYKHAGSTGLSNSTSSSDYFDIYYAEDIGDEANMVQRFLNDTSLDYTGSVTNLTYHFEFKEEIIENTPEFDGRFFVKIEIDPSLRKNVLKEAVTTEQYVTIGSFNVDYIESESTTSAQLLQDGVQSTWAWGQGDGWWYNAFNEVDQWTSFSNGGSPYAWDGNQGPSSLSGQLSTGGVYADSYYAFSGLTFWQGMLNGGEGNQTWLMNDDGSWEYYYWDAPNIIMIVPQEQAISSANTDLNATAGGNSVSGLGGGFAWYCWDAQTKSFWSSRKASRASRPFIDAAAIAGTRQGSYVDYDDYPQFRTMTIGTAANQRPTGLDDGQLTNQIMTNNGLTSTTPTAGTLGRMCLAVTGYASYASMNTADRQFMEKMKTTGTIFRFTGDPDNIYRVLMAEDYVDAANDMDWYSTYDHIEVSQYGGNNIRLGFRINFRKVDESTNVTHDGIDVSSFDPRGTVRHDGTASTGIEILRHTRIGGGQVIVLSDMAVFETEPKEDTDLDIYYEGSSSLPLVLNEENINNFVPMKCGISIERPDQDTIKNITLPLAQSLDIINNPTNIVSNIIAKPRLFNTDSVLPSDINGESPRGIGDPIVHITNIDGAGTEVDQSNGIYVGDYIVFHHKNGTRTRSKITGFYEKITTTNTDGDIIGTRFSPIHSHVGSIQANPNVDGWPSNVVTSGDNDWDFAAGNYINTITIFEDEIDGNVSGTAPLEVGMQMVGYVEIDADTGDEVTDGLTGIAPPGIVVEEILPPDDNGDYIKIKVTSATDTPFYWTKSDGTLQTWEDFNSATGANQMGRKFKVEFIHPPTGYYSIDKNAWKYQVDLDWFNCYSYGNGVESDRIRDTFNAPQIDNGVRVSSTFSGYRKENKTSGLIYSGIYNSTSEVNNLNEFNMSQKITKDLNPSYGSIQRLKTRDTDVVVFTEDKILKVLSNKDALYNADGNPQLTATEMVLGQAVPFVGDYGISKNPESLAWDQYRMYFTDKQRGAVLRLSRDGLTPISNVGMKTWFRDNLKLADRALGTFDAVSGEYNLTLTKTGGDSNYDTTISFSEESKGWVSFKSFIPLNGGSVSGSYITSNMYVMWKHYFSTSYNTFYANSYESSISVLFNDSPGTIKSFNSINYEGSQAKVVQNTTDTNEFYNLDSKTGWYVNSIETDKQSGTVPEFIEKEGKWFNKINGVETTLSNLDTSEFTVQGVGEPYSVSSIYYQGDTTTGGGSTVGG
tara:strand:+ start:2637 stop:9521 length:6885 start_codon:yes stop_codon:yes gene_type:complete